MEKNSQPLTKIKIVMAQIVPGFVMVDSGMGTASAPIQMVSTPGVLHPMQLVCSGGLSEALNTP